jgi:hypothetical protein
MKKHAAATAADPRTTLTAAILSMDLLTCLDKIDDSTNGQPRGDLARTMEHSSPVAVGRPRYGNQATAGRRAAGRGSISPGRAAGALTLGGMRAQRPQG